MAGLHIVKRAKAGKPVRWYVYAWRGGPQIHTQEGGDRPKITPALLAAASDELRAFLAPPPDTLAGLKCAFMASPEWLRLSKSTKVNWTLWLSRLDERFGTAPLAVFEDRRMRGDLLAWRDQWAMKPRAADMAMQATSRLLAWGVERGRLAINVAAGAPKLYAADRAAKVWLDTDLERFLGESGRELGWAVRLAALTGLRRGDLIRLPLSAIGPRAIVWATAKSMGKARVTIPLIPEARELIEEILAAHPKPDDPTAPLLFSSLGTPWSADGLETSFARARKRAGLTLRIHDLRGTFATRCMLAGMTDQEIADILGWTTRNIAAIRRKYVDQARTVIALGERLANARITA